MAMILLSKSSSAFGHIVYIAKSREGIQVVYIRGRQSNMFWLVIFHKADVLGSKFEESRKEF